MDEAIGFKPQQHLKSIFYNWFQAPPWTGWRKLRCWTTSWTPPRSRPFGSSSPGIGSRPRSCSGQLTSSSTFYRFSRNSKKRLDSFHSELVKNKMLKWETFSKCWTSECRQKLQSILRLVEFDRIDHFFESAKEKADCYFVLGLSKTGCCYPGPPLEVLAKGINASQVLVQRFDSMYLL